MTYKFMLFLPYLFFSSFGIFINACSASDSDGHSKHQQDPSTNIHTQKDSIPFFVCGTFFNSNKSFNSKELTRLFETGRACCTADIKEDMKQRYGLANYPAIRSINEMDFRNDSLLLVTTIDSLDARLQTLLIDGISFFKEPKKYSFWLRNAKKNFDFDKDITSYTHTGVTAITRSTGRLLDNISQEEYLRNLLPYFKDRALVHISNEVSIVDDCNYSEMKLKFATKTNHLDVLKKLKANIIELTGNHNLDYGIDPYLNTFKWYANNKMQYFGGGSNPEEAQRPLIVTLKDGQKIAWIGFNELCPCGECTENQKTGAGANKYAYSKAQTTIEKLKKEEKVNYIIACVQFGERDSYEPTASQIKISKELIDLGADVLIGSQAHQPQTVQLYKGKLIFYGLGNFLFDQIHRTGVRQAFFLECYFYRGNIIQFQPVFTMLATSRIPTLATEAEEKEIRNVLFIKKNFN